MCIRTPNDCVYDIICTFCTIDFDDEKCDNLLQIVVPVAVSVAVLYSITLIALCCPLAYRKKKNTDVKVKEANDKTMTVIIQLLETMYCQVDMVPEDRMDQFMEIINYYNSVISKISMLETNALRDIQLRCRNMRADGDDTESDDGTDGRFTYT